jgi:hypothetical protein
VIETSVITALGDGAALELGEEAEELAALVGAKGREDLFEKAHSGSEDAFEIGSGGWG